MAADILEQDFTSSLGCLLEPSVAALATQLRDIAGLSPAECDVIVVQTRASLYSILHGKLTRLLLLELNAARVNQRLQGDDAAARWSSFIELSSTLAFWNALHEHYPTLLERIATVVRHRCETSWLFAQRWVADRDTLVSFCGAPAGELVELSFGAGDSHRGGFTVALLRCQGGRVVYKPRSVAVDVALFNVIDVLAEHHGRSLTIGVPRAVDRYDYGWTEFTEHRYAASDDELASFYRGIGHWLAIMHLLGASDLHAENLIAHGAKPVVVDCETLFTPKVAMPASDFGQALDRASELVAGTVLNIGLLPGRAQTLGWRGIDYSGVGSLPGEQPMMPTPTILNAGTDEAYLGMTLAPVPIAQNHPSAQPALALYWPRALEAFDELTATLRRLDSADELQPLLQTFADCRVRVVLRATEAYSELARMLWHPMSLHNEAPARRRVHDLLTKMAANSSSAPSDPAVIESEIDDLLVGDIPVFSTLVRHGELEGSRGDRWLPANDLAAAALSHWRACNFTFERNVIRAAMVSAYLNDGWTSHLGSLTTASVRLGDLDQRRRKVAARIIQGLLQNAIRGDDHSVAWVSPVLGAAGWSVQPLATDLYGGLSGVALLAAAYAREMRAGRADDVDGIESLSHDVQHTLRLAELGLARTRERELKVRPPTPGAYIGLGSQIWTLLVLAHWNHYEGDEVQRAIALAAQMPEAAAADDMNDVLTGKAGAIPALLALHACTHDAQFLDMAKQLGDQLCALAQQHEDRAHWVHPQLWPRGLGGFSHGVTGVGWALTKLARATGVIKYEEVAHAAFEFEDSLFDSDERNWRDLRNLGGPKTAAVWCHGSVGIGLAHLDLDPTAKSSRTKLIVQRAVHATSTMGMGWNHCLCHGDFSAWELLDQAIACGMGPAEMTRDGLLAQLLTSLEDHGPTCGLTREVFVPGLLPGLGGVAYQLLRAHRDSDLPSVLTPGIVGLHDNSQRPWPREQGAEKADFSIEAV